MSAAGRSHGAPRRAAAAAAPALEEQRRGHGGRGASTARGARTERRHEHARAPPVRATIGATPSTSAGQAPRRDAGALSSTLTSSSGPQASKASSSVGMRARRASGTSRSSGERQSRDALGSAAQAREIVVVEDDHLARRAAEHVELDAVGAVGAPREGLDAVLGGARARAPMPDDERRPRAGAVDMTKAYHRPTAN